MFTVISNSPYSAEVVVPAPILPRVSRFLGDYALHLSTFEHRLRSNVLATVLARWVVAPLQRRPLLLCALHLLQHTLNTVYVGLGAWVDTRIDLFDSLILIRENNIIAARLFRGNLLIGFLPLFSH